ncbi:MAG: YdiU family protein [Marinicella sp.]
MMQHQYADLGRQFAIPTLPEKIGHPKVLLWNQPLAEQLGLDLTETEQAQYFSGQKLFSGSKPVAMAYAGHQFGHFNPQLGDGRAHLLGEFNNLRRQIQEIHLKGSGRTPFSRNGDGRCAIKPAVREYIMSEAMYALGVPTTRTLAVVTTDETLFRQQPTTGAIITRVATSHLRIGTFEYFAARGLYVELEQLVDLAIDRHYPQINKNEPNKYIKLLSHVIDKQIELIVNWMRVGFIHGVMNTDNILLSGETIDYGPCAMLEVYNPATVFSSIDESGRYAFANQPNIAQWNMVRLAECFIPLIDDNQNHAINQVMPLLEGFVPTFKTAYYLMLAHKLGFNEANPAIKKLSQELLVLMQQNQLDYTQTFDYLTSSLQSKQSPHPTFNDWYEKWQMLLTENNASSHETSMLMRQNNPLLIPRNHHIEAVLAHIETHQSAERVWEFLKPLESPYTLTETTEKYQKPNPEFNESYQTFCGT